MTGWTLREYTQAAMVTTSVAMLRVMEEQGYRADVAAGLKPWRILRFGGGGRYVR